MPPSRPWGWSRQITSNEYQACSSRTASNISCMNKVKKCFGKGFGWICALNIWSVQERAQTSFCPITLESAQPSPIQKEGINAPFPKCTSEAAQWFCYINITLRHTSHEFGVKGVSGGLGLCRFPARKVAWV
jgi:hypothetical protein